MRPRPGGRGEAGGGGRRVRSAGELQCGHDPEAVETEEGTRCTFPAVGFIASMRPRPGGRGERRQDPCGSTCPKL